MQQQDLQIRIHGQIDKMTQTRQRRRMEWATILVKWKQAKKSPHTRICLRHELMIMCLTMEVRNAGKRKADAQDSSLLEELKTSTPREVVQALSNAFWPAVDMIRIQEKEHLSSLPFSICRSIFSNGLMGASLRKNAKDSSHIYSGDKRGNHTVRMREVGPQTP